MFLLSCIHFVPSFTFFTSLLRSLLHFTSLPSLYFLHFIFFTLLSPLSSLPSLCLLHCIPSSTFFPFFTSPLRFLLYFAPSLLLSLHFLHFALLHFLHFTFPSSFTSFIVFLPLRDALDLFRQKVSNVSV